MTFSLPFLPHYQNHLNAPNICNVVCAVVTEAETCSRISIKISTCPHDVRHHPAAIDKIRKEKRHYLSESDEGLEIPVDSTQEKEIFSSQVSFFDFVLGISKCFELVDKI